MRNAFKTLKPKWNRLHRYVDVNRIIILKRGCDVCCESVMFQVPYKAENLLTRQATGSLSRSTLIRAVTASTAGRKWLNRLYLHLAAEFRASNSSVISPSVRKPFDRTTYDRRSLNYTSTAQWFIYFGSHIEFTWFLPPRVSPLNFKHIESRFVNHAE